MKKIISSFMLFLVILSICSCDNGDGSSIFSGNDIVIVTLGNTFEASDGDEKVEITVNSVDFEEEVTSPFTKYGFPNKDNEIYVVAKLTIKNIGYDRIQEKFFDDVVVADDKEIKLVLDGKYNYKMLAVNSEDSIFSEYWSIDPLKSKEIYFIKTVPDELALKPLEISFSFGSNKTLYKYTQE